MKFLKYLLSAATAIVLLFACQKELNFEGGVSVGSLKSAATGDCLPSIVMGAYAKDSTLNTTNYIDVHVNITQPGTFVVKSDTVNGFSFYKEGTLGNQGDNVVRLYATGKPTAAGTTTFTIKYGTSVCMVNVVVTGPGGGGGGGAVFTLGGAPGACTGATQNGTYMSGTALTAANTLTITVNVTTIGAFTIGALPGNGFGFASSGTFTTTGVQTVTLNAVGTPIAPGITSFNITDGTQTCTVPVTVTAGGPVAAYTLAETTGNCTGAIVSGTYTVGVPLNAADSVKLSVNVTTAGAYSITTTLVNGMLFAATGTFTSTGVQTVKLAGGGIPTAPGINNFPASGVSNSCTFSITTTPPTGSSAVYTLGGGPGACAGALSNGTYAAGTPLTAANTVSITAIVVTPGTYPITTVAANGMQFTGLGTFTAAGSQAVLLTGIGTPVAAGTNNYTATATGTGSTCTFSVTTAAAPVANNDFFPLTQNSWWSYISDATAPSDSLTKRSTTNTTVGGNTYRIFTLADNAGVYDNTNYRKSGSDYYQRMLIDSFTSFYFDVPQYGELLFLKENAAVNTTWTSAVFTGAVTDPGPPTTVYQVSLRYQYKVASNNGTLVVNGVTYTNVTKIESKSEFSLDGGATYQDDVGCEAWYAKGIGLIKFRLYDITTPTQQAVDNLKRYQVF